MTDKRTEIETAATAAVQRSGLNNVSFRTLANSVGVKSSSVHYYFAEKSDLANAIIERYADEFSARLTLISDNGDSIHAKLDAFVKLFQDVVVEDKFCLCGMMAAEIDSLSDENRQQLARYFRSTEDWLVQTLKGAKIDSIKPQTLARLILSGLEGAILIDRVTGGTDRIKAQRTLIRHMVPK